MYNEEIQIVLAYDEIDTIKELFTEYRDMLVETYKYVEGISFCFTGFQRLDTLQEKYALPKEDYILRSIKAKLLDV